MNANFSFDLLFEYSQAVTPYLAGRFSPLEPSSETVLPSVTYDASCSNEIQALYQSLATSNPEAKQAYWLTRTWGLLCWQPIYLSFISIYACRGLPSIKTMTQDIQSEFIAGYQFNDKQVRVDEQNELIRLAAKELNELFEFYRSEIGAWTRIRPGFTQYLFADAILDCIVKVQAYLPDLPNEYLLEQAKLWVESAQLPLASLRGLKVNPKTNKLHLVRTSCCLVYKCEGRKLCDDCPKHPNNKKGMPKQAVAS